jgi:hypothetical protein
LTILKPIPIKINFLHPKKTLSNQKVFAKPVSLLEFPFAIDLFLIELFCGAWILVRTYIPCALMIPKEESQASLLMLKKWSILCVHMKRIRFNIGEFATFRFPLCVALFLELDNSFFIISTAFARLDLWNMWNLWWAVRLRFCLAKFQLFFGNLLKACFPCYSSLDFTFKLSGFLRELFEILGKFW